MAAVIHELWERNDSSLLIMPATVPIDALAVSSELTRYLEEGWTPVIESDIDGPNALPLRLDRDNPNLGRYSAISDDDVDEEIRRRLGAATRAAASRV